MTLATLEDLGWYACRYRANYPLLVDHDFKAVNRYGAGSYPTIYGIDARGVVRFAAQGAIPRSTLAPKIERSRAFGRTGRST